MLLLNLLLIVSDTFVGFRSSMTPLLSVLMAAITDEEQLESWRNLSLEVMVTLCETAPAMMRKLALKEVQTLVPILLKFMMEI